MAAKSFQFLEYTWGAIKGSIRDYARAKKMLDELGVIRPGMQKALEKLNDLPTDIEPVRAAILIGSPV
jgi:hypothetical protein